MSEVEAEERPEEEASPPSEGVEERPVIVTVEHRFKHATGKVECVTDMEETVAMVPFQGPTASVYRKYGVTINLENYEGARVDVGITVPCYLQDAARADKWAQQFIEKRLAEEVTTIRGDDEGSEAGGEGPL